MADVAPDIKFNKDWNIIRMDGTEITVHCHHYNAEVQRALEFTKRASGPEVMKSVAEEVFYRMLTKYMKGRRGMQEKLLVAADIYKLIGLGRLDFSRLTEKIVLAPSSHTTLGWLLKFGSRTTPGCHLTAGYIAGALRAMTGEHYQVLEEKCRAADSEICKFTLRKVGKKGDAEFEMKECNRSTFVPAEKEPVTHDTTVDEEKIIHAVSQIGLAGRGDGYIPMFGVCLTTLPVDFYNWACYGFEKTLEKIDQDLAEEFRGLLSSAGEACGLHTLGGVMASPQWAAMIKPMISRREDNIYALTAVVNCLGSGRWDVHELIPGEKLVMRVYTPYEAIGYREMYGLADGGKCYSLTGKAAAMMELVYGEGRTEERFGTFKAAESKCIAMGDGYCEIVAAK